jgi:outer membrane receptor protein involved in Fe transport
VFVRVIGFRRHRAAGRWRSHLLSGVVRELDVQKDRHIQSDSYTVFDAHLKWEREFQVDGLAFTLSGTNLTNEEHKTTGVDFGALGWWGNNFGDPRRFQLQMDYRF